MGPTWVSPGDDRTQVGPMLAPWTLLSGNTQFLLFSIRNEFYTGSVYVVIITRQYGVGTTYNETCNNEKRISVAADLKTNRLGPKIIQFPALSQDIVIQKTRYWHLNVGEYNLVSVQL